MILFISVYLREYPSDHRTKEPIHNTCESLSQGGPQQQSPLSQTDAVPYLVPSKRGHAMCSQKSNTGS